MEQRLRNEAKALLEQGKVDWIIGFEPGSLKFTTTPVITKDKNDVDRLVINPFIVNNLANFLTEVTGRVGIVAKGCDSRSIVSLIQDNKVVREDVIILGVPCPGIIDLSKVERLAGKDRDELDDISREGDKIIIKVGADKKEFAITEALFDNCLACELPTPQEYDILLGEPSSPVVNKPAAQAKIEKLKQMTPEQRWEFWKNELSQCIRCYACRNVCPACYCQRCFVEETEPQWILPTPRWQDNLIFQIVRNIHVAGRCTDCGECERACPVNIPLRSLTKEMYDIVGELFSFKAGMDKDAPPLMTHYEQEEAEDFFR
ncbi:MAG: 4Fe-4S dicluster domain-containing protein [Dehalococcoidia bacterium]|nr:4Fe-4S dicluster domain-containing protein [Dehalococcoidia bacterium]